MTTRVGVMTGWFLLVLSGCAGFAWAAGETEAERPPKESPPPAEQKPKRDADAKAPDAPTPSPPDDKPAKTEEPPTSQAPAPPKQDKQDEQAGKKPVTSINLSIKLALMADPSLFPFDIEVEMDNHKAVLSGAVSTEDEKTKAAEIARKVEGVEAVVNKLSVSPARRDAWIKKHDEALTQIVKDRLSKSETLKTAGFDVKSENGIISLSGKTRFQVIALEAAEAARHVPGVRAVTTAAVQITGKD